MPLEVEGRSIIRTSMHTLCVNVGVHDSVPNKDRAIEALIMKGGGVVLPVSKGKGKALLLSSATRLADLYAAVEEAVTDGNNSYIDAGGEKNRVIVYATLTRALGLGALREGKRAIAHANNNESNPMVTLLLPNSDALKRAIKDDETTTDGAATVDAYCESLFGLEGLPIEDEDEEEVKLQSPTNTPSLSSPICAASTTTSSREGEKKMNDIDVQPKEPIFSRISHMCTTLAITVAIVRGAGDGGGEGRRGHEAREVYTPPCVDKEMINAASERARYKDGMNKDENERVSVWTLVSSRLMNRGVPQEALRHASKTGRKAAYAARLGLRFPNLVNTSGTFTDLPPELVDTISNMPGKQHESLITLLCIGTTYYGGESSVNPDEDDEEPTHETLLLQQSILRVFV